MLAIRKVTKKLLKSFRQEVHYITNNRYNQTKHDTTYINDIEDELGEIDLILESINTGSIFQIKLLIQSEHCQYVLQEVLLPFYTYSQTHNSNRYYLNGAKRIAIKLQMS